jgi:hypothetical protein
MLPDFLVTAEGSRNIEEAQSAFRIGGSSELGLAPELRTILFGDFH